MIFGDSITGQNSSSATIYNAVGWFNWANALMGQPFQLLNNAGVSGETSTQMLARIQSSVLNYKPGWCFVLAGANDIATYDATPAVIEANLTAIYQILNANGIKVVGMTIGPSTNYDTTNKRTTWALVNAWIKEYARTANNFHLVDTAASYTDPTNAAVIGIANSTQDGVHPTNLGGRLMGIAIANVLRSFVPPIQTMPVWTGSASNLAINGFMAGTSGIVGGSDGSGQLADSWTLHKEGSATCVVAKDTRADGMGAVQTISITAIASVLDGCHITSSSMISGVSAGDVVVAQAEILPGSVIERTTDFYLLTTGGAGGNAHSFNPYPNLPGSIDLGITTTDTMIIRTPKFTIPTGTANVYAVMQVVGNGSLLKLGRVDVHKVAP